MSTGTKMNRRLPDVRKVHRLALVNAVRRLDLSQVRQLSGLDRGEWLGRGGGGRRRGHG